MFYDEIMRTLCRKNKKITKRISKRCAVCGKDIKVVCYSDKTYRGGHYFFDIPISTNAEKRKAFRAGTREWKFGGRVFQILKRDPKPYKHVEYWECPKCYWR
ncbi:MAG: hypothetical protein A3C08_00275 [Candidatus Taylorbacteria bacterium RIFCSPHIGHO2_02_FULL_47_18]|uniref:Uncharacterized protein n=1 Tax=Candidatus Taylorbacteria bacterium RIFCSPLOWO2_01_FULL_48_100 TaxID=1802322 RepID=A0A1G2NEE5_9BACT|nr:MAG: hypothetical protein A2670_00010 [Candidatus Taylorbacteria bacterium RIFCSPHIGHO2_01_FULL_48_38]OHA27918.1 MAG: hypothetical protein A3C08_00275 [Candidatus Taylorbacteria bacterium RIFCSPHIGHO2_02_FULL_47_18]OHA34455.1 MAG: hypothetical protein A2938_01260 [Candidatus Taylorbacteria bacterium RIFCSPLOWO2_01_FULL_48_100]OHA40117.1 MAG: hypothetical protein A3J31_00820 [Candidatus Taylorbacteria bacterium RIFCSPLOWO2_02_FULL_48_16]OHA45548.1 MAG: hypothetical protein A3H13_02025 [Candid